MAAESRKRRVNVGRGLYRRPSDGKYEMGYTDASGTWRMRTLMATTKTEAVAEQQSFMVALRGGKVATTARVTLSSLATMWLTSFETRVESGERAPRTLESYRFHTRRLDRALGQKNIQSISTDAVAQVLEGWRKDGTAPRTNRETLGVLSRMYAFAIRRGLATSNPVSALERHERPTVRRSEQRVLTHDEIARLLASSNNQARLLVALAVFTGARQSEILGLRWCDVDLTGGTVHIRSQWERATKGRPARLKRLTKTEAGRREIVLVPQLAGVLKRAKLASEFSGPDDFVLARLPGRPISHRRCSELWETARSAAGLDSVKLHECRHSFASHLVVDLGVDAVQVSKMMGHSKASITTDTYAHLFDKARHADAIRASMANSAFGHLLNQVD
jgi:integrase